MTKTEKTRWLQNLALRAYYDHNGEGFDDCESESELPKGDTLALFIWREVGDAEGGALAAADMLHHAREEVEAVWRELLDESAEQKRRRGNTV